MVNSKTICIYEKCDKKHLCKRFRKEIGNNTDFIGGIGCVNHNYFYFIKK